MYNLIIDLEMCNVPRDYRKRSYKYANETIQIGAVLLDEDFKRIGTLCQYVHPEYGVRWCSNGFSNENVFWHNVQKQSDFPGHR